MPHQTFMNHIKVIECRDKHTSTQPGRIYCTIKVHNPYTTTVLTVGLQVNLGYPADLMVSFLHLFCTRSYEYKWYRYFQSYDLKTKVLGCNSTRVQFLKVLVSRPKCQGLGLEFQVLVLVLRPVVKVLVSRFNGKYTHILKSRLRTA